MPINFSEIQRINGITNFSIHSDIKIINYINNYINNDKIEFPKWQREDCWNDDYRTTLIESILLCSDLPKIYLSKQPDGRFYLLDGGHRTRTIKDFMDNNYYIIIDDDFNTTNISGNFTTRWTPSRGSITISNVFPWNNSINISLQPTLKIQINHSLGYTMNISWYYGNNGTAMNNLFNTTTNVTNGTYYMINHYIAQHYNQEYGWKIVVDEGDFNETRIYYFTCADQTGGGGRSPMVAMTMGIGFALLIFVLLIGYIESTRKKKEEE